MPVFDFICQDCQNIFEFSRPFGSNEVPNCTNCKSKNVKKQIAPPSIHFKGDGFYKTDSAKKSAKKIDTTAQKEEKNTEKKSDEKKADAKKKDDIKKNDSN